jgi:hypothetical protein
MRGLGTAAVLLAGALVAGCSGSSQPAAERERRTPTATASPSPSASPTQTPTPSDTVTPTPSPAAVAPFSGRAALRDVEHLAGTIGPRPAESGAFRAAARWVQRRLAGLGYRVEREVFRAPAGVSWGVPVPGGRTWNVVARPPGLGPGDPYRIVGAHLDTVPQAPGAEDNASGVAVVLELARLAAAAPPKVPVVLVAYGAEEPRNASGTAHHFGSLTQVDRLGPDERESLRAMVALDRVGVGATVPVCDGGAGGGDVRRALLAAARRAGVPAQDCGGDLNRASDHWSFERAGLPAARVGSTPYAGYHSPGDVPSVVSPAQLRRTGRLLWEWLTS